MALALLLGGLVPPVLVVVYYARIAGLSVRSALAWNGGAAVAGGHVSVLAVIEWSVVARLRAERSCVIAARSARQAGPAERRSRSAGPVTYAGPGSLGGTKSALRR